MFHEAYPNLSVDYDLLFDYICGLLHSPDYRRFFDENLLKQLPRIPLVELPEDFSSLAEAGKELGDLHVNKEEARPSLCQHQWQDAPWSGSLIGSVFPGT